MFSQIGTGVVDRRANQVFDILLFCNHVSSLQDPDLLANVLGSVDVCEVSSEERQKQDAYSLRQRDPKQNVLIFSQIQPKRSAGKTEDLSISHLSARILPLSKKCQRLLIMSSMRKCRNMEKKSNFARAVRNNHSGGPSGPRNAARLTNAPPVLLLLGHRLREAVNDDGKKYDRHPCDRAVAWLVLLQRAQHVVAQAAGGHHARDCHHRQCHHRRLVGCRP